MFDLGKLKVRYVGWLWRCSGFTFNTRRIFLHRRVQKWGKQRRTALLRHELRHVEQMERDGTVRVWLRWLFCPRWRFIYEIQAYAETIKTYAARGNLDMEAFKSEYVELVRNKYLTRRWVTFDEGMKMLTGFLND